MGIILAFLAFFAVPAAAQDGWVDQLRSDDGRVCCANNDGRRLDDPEWRTAGDGYEVLFTEGWLKIPARALVTMRNHDGIARVWSFKPEAAERTVHCFLPGSMG